MINVLKAIRPEISKGKSVKPAARRRARECAVQALYSWQLSQNDIADVEYQFLAEQDVKDVDVLYFRELLAGWRLTPHTSTD